MGAIRTYYLAFIVPPPPVILSRVKLLKYLPLIERFA